MWLVCGAGVGVEKVVSVERERERQRGKDFMFCFFYFVKSVHSNLWILVASINTVYSYPVSC